MKKISVLFSLFAMMCLSLQTTAQKNQSAINTSSDATRFFLDVHQLEPGKVTYADVAAAHQKDLATQDKFGVNFIRFWVDEADGLVYCLSSASDCDKVRQTHAEAHGLIPTHVYEVTEGQAAAIQSGKNLFLDFHYLGAGKVTAQDVANAHTKDLATQGKYGVNFVNYWVDEKEGLVMCLSEAADSSDVIRTHKEAHGLIPAKVLLVKQGE
ncbi:MAG TPA: DUF4242 domain-containing protein [Bacteroidia bacterium]|nr:DUF4242 domain-containing protein [Bacteroidia bacterium]